MQEPISLDFPSGIQRDGTAFDALRCLDSQWVRWRLGRPRSIPGYQLITDTLNGIPRKIFIYYLGAYAVIHIGTTAGIQQVIVNYAGNFVSIIDRTPSTGFTPGTPVGWTLDAIFDANTGIVQLIAHAVPDTGYPTSIMATVPFLGPITGSSPLVQFSTPPSGIGGGAYSVPTISGGIVCTQPYVFDFGEGGLVQWSAPNIPLTLGVTGGTTGAGQARISAQKIVAGIPLRGGGVQQPAILFFSLSEVITGNFVGSSSGIFAFSTVSSSSSILSTDCVIEYDGLYFWAGVGRFLMYNGTVQEVPNPQNQDWFFNNLNWPYAGKVQAFKVPEMGEIWWLAPMFGNTENSHAIIFNLRENAWYDTVLPNGGRAVGSFAQGLRWPIMGGTTNDGNGYSLWLHEIGTDQVTPSGVTPVVKYFVTPLIGGPKNPTPSDKGLSVQQLEPDFIQTGDMSVNLITTPNARAPVAQGSNVPIYAIPNGPGQQFASFKSSARLTSLQIASNTAGGSFIGGKNLLHVEPSEPRLNS